MSKMNLLIIIILISTLCSCTKSPNISKVPINQTVDNASKDAPKLPYSKNTDNNNIRNKTPYKNNDTTVNIPAENLYPNSYYILGDSNKLTKSQTDSMNDWRKKIKLFSSKNMDNVFLNGQTKEKTVSLTFDDGPDLKIMPKILDVLKQYNVKGNFFLIGNQIQSCSAVVKRAYDEGNLVLNHSFNHPDLINIKDNIVNNEIISTENEIFKVIGKRPSLMRPPYGDINSRVLSILLKNDYKAIIWSTDSLDWSQKEKTNIVKNVIDSVRPGEIILMHCNSDKQATLEALPTIITSLQNKGYKIIDLSEMLNVKAYK